MIDLQRTPQASWLYRWLLLVLAINLAIVAAMATGLGLGGRSTELKVIIVLAYTSFMSVLALALPLAMRWLLEHRGGPPWFIVPTAVLDIAAVSAVVISLGEAGLGLLPVADLWRVTRLSLGIAVVTTLGLGVGIVLHEAHERRAPSRLPSRGGRPRSRRAGTCTSPSTR